MPNQHASIGLIRKTVEHMRTFTGIRPLAVQAKTSFLSGHAVDISTTGHSCLHTVPTRSMCLNTNNDRRL